MGQASSLSIRDDRQDAGPTSNLFLPVARLPRANALAMTIFRPRDLGQTCRGHFQLTFVTGYVSVITRKS